MECKRAAEVLEAQGTGMPVDGVAIGEMTPADPPKVCHLDSGTASTSAASMHSLSMGSDSLEVGGRNSSPAAALSKSCHLEQSCHQVCLEGLMIFTGLKKSGWEQQRSKRELSSNGYEFAKLEEVGILGSGAFGVVSLVRCGVTGRTMALKSVSKGVVVHKSLQRGMMWEKAAMQRVSSPFVTRLLSTFNDHDHLHFLMEVALGGDLLHTYHRHGYTGSPAPARFYAACVARALDHLHGRLVLYRDLKMENVVVDQRGYGKLCDFGMAACFSQPNERAWTLCGTSGHMAPEILAGSGYSFAVDWWGLGILVYELLMGVGPFAATDAHKTMAKVELGIDSVDMPRHEAWCSFVRSLCRRSPEERLPAGPGGMAALQDHPWFSEASFDWALHARCAMPPPHIPSLDGPEDTSNFDLVCDRPRDLTYVDPGTGWDEDF